MKPSAPQPNWREVRDYPDPRTISRDRLAFAFLWRDQAFREVWRSVVASARAAPDHIARSDARQPLKRWGIEAPLLREWGFDSPVRFRRPPYGGAFLTGTDDRLYWIHESPKHLRCFAFDLRYPIAPQLERAGAALRAHRRSLWRSSIAMKGGQRDRADYRAMLRVLDAREAGVGFAEIASVLYPRQDGAVDRVKKLHREGSRLRDGGYLALLALRDPPAYRRDRKR